MSLVSNPELQRFTKIVEEAVGEDRRTPSSTDSSASGWSFGPDTPPTTRPSSPTPKDRRHGWSGQRSLTPVSKDPVVIPY